METYYNKISLFPLFVVSVHPTTQYVRFTYLWMFFLWKILVCQ